jgi:hypothetical protein
MHALLSIIKEHNNNNNNNNAAWSGLHTDLPPGHSGLNCMENNVLFPSCYDEFGASLFHWTRRNGLRTPMVSWLG